MAKEITEEMGIHKEWYKEAKTQTVETLPDFIKHLTEDYIHDYGTIVHAMAAAGLAAIWAINKTEQGGITGFQAGALQWMFIRNWSKQDNKLGMQLVDFDDFLFPQSCKPLSISFETWEEMKKIAETNLKEYKGAHPKVIKHWQKIVDGKKIPFLTVEPKEADNADA